jgi:hypothetical protein
VHGKIRPEKERNRPVAFQKGQEVEIKNLAKIVGTVIGPRPADKNIPEAEQTYFVEISRKLVCRGADLVAAEPSEKLERYSAEWLAELNHWFGLGQQWFVNQNDQALAKQFMESAAKLGYLVPVRD